MARTSGVLTTGAELADTFSPLQGGVELIRSTGLDQSAEFLTAANDLDAGRGGIIALDADGYTIKNLVLPRGVSLEGPGADVTQITNPSSTGEDCVSISSRNSHLRGFKMDGVTGGGAAIRFLTGASRSVVDDIYINNVGGNGVQYDNANYLITCRNVEVAIAAGKGWYVASGATSHNALVWINCYANTCVGRGWELRNIAAGTLINCAADGAAAVEALYLATSFLDIIEFTVENGAYRGITVAGSGRYRLHGCRTINQVLPMYVDGSGAVISHDFVTTSTPSGNAVEVTTSGTSSSNILIRGSLDAPLSITGNGKMRRDLSGTGSPEGSVVGSKNSQYLQSDAAAGTGKWRKDSGVGNTGWVDDALAVRPPGGYVAGSYYGPSGGATTTRTQTLNDLRLVPYYVRDASKTFDRIRCEVTAAGGAGSVARLGIWAHDETTGLPGALIYDAGASGSASTVLGNGLIDATNVSAQEVTISQALPQGRVWLGIACQVAGTPAFRAFTGATPPFGIDLQAASGSAYGVTNSIIVSGVSGAFSTLVGATFASNSVAIAISLRAA